MLQLLAQITLKSTDDGGREKPIYSGYRPSFFANDGNSDCVLYFNSMNIKPNETHTVDIMIIHPELVGIVRKGDTFTLREGHRIVAEGTINKIEA